MGIFGISPEEEKRRNQKELVDIIVKLANDTGTPSCVLCAFVVARVVRYTNKFTIYDSVGHNKSYSLKDFGFGQLSQKSAQTIFKQVARRLHLTYKETSNHRSNSFNEETDFIGAFTKQAWAYQLERINSMQARKFKNL